MTTLSIKQPSFKALFWALILLTVFALGMMASRLTRPVTLGGGTTLKPCASCSSCACPTGLSGGYRCACPR